MRATDILRCGFCSLLISVFASNAQAEGGYFGIEGGLAFADIRADDTAQVLVNTFGGSVAYEYDAATLSGRISGGYGFNEMVGLEVGYFFTGDFDATYNGLSGGGVVYSAVETYSATGLDLSVLLHPMSGGFFLRLGMHNSEVEGVGTFNVPGLGSASAAATVSGTGLLVGLGYD